MYTKAFDFDLPPELIAQYPLPNRSDSRLLVYNRSNGETSHHQFKQLVDFIEPQDLLVMNDSKVIPARFYGQKETGGKIECLVERCLDDRHFLALIKASKAPKSGQVIYLDDEWQFQVIEKNDDLYYCKASGSLQDMLDRFGHIPLPPYINREDDQFDTTRYQTIYAKHSGAVAAPTAGLHFDQEVMDALEAKGIRCAYATLHVGAGTFQPVRAEHIRDHKMHSEHYIVSQELADAVNQTRKAGGRIIAVGTTALRTLESASLVNDELHAGSGDTDIFIYPGYEFKLCDGLLTNFHLPQSTLLMLVAAFVGYQEIMSLYQTAIEAHYRFFSYGDATLLL